MSGVTNIDIHNPSAAYISAPNHIHHTHDGAHFSPDHDHDNLDLSLNPDSDMPGRRSATVEVPATQRMLAACSGSLLTSLIVTPLDVVRVRLQAQTHPTSSPASQSSSSSSSTIASRAHRLPIQPFTLPTAAHISRPVADLGVTACCREVFWVSSTNELCLAYPSIGNTVPGSSSLTKSTETCLVESTASHRFTGTWEGLVKIARNEGLPSLYRGLSPTLLMSIPANVIYFTGYESLRYSSKSPLSKLSDNMAPLVAGSLARTIAATVIAPLELFKTRLQAASSHPKRGTATAAAEDSVSAFRQTIMGVRSMVAHEGVTSLWRGLMLTLWRDVPFSGIYWWGYETVRDFLAQERYGRKHHLGPIERRRVDNDTLSQEEDKMTFTDSFVAGATSGAVAAFVTTPFDVGKTRRQVWRAATEVPGDVNTTSMMKSEGSMPKVLAEIYQREGMSGLFRGCIPRMLKVAPACAIMISSYEIGKKAAMRMKTEKQEKD
ncbi:hypothetical protein H072_1762 [Dactylellina haptotyla CBS 200.50]|uniref:Mitochondrial carrier protein n=1 Tax=Dactylellina haptotyla (strain CBS 200.50) TaxID=1284197 RepID=S8BXH6_DACHA|nr:hypothetical protein H072_1762 [Dactylellina haptotyla CBS 200.50]